MLDAALLLAFCLLMGLLSLGIVIWVAIFRQLFSLDNLLLVLISLTVGGIFMANFAWSVYTGEVREVLDYLLKRSTKSDASGAPPPA